MESEMEEVNLEMPNINETLVFCKMLVFAGLCLLPASLQIAHTFLNPYKYIEVEWNYIIYWHFVCFIISICTSLYLMYFVLMSTTLELIRRDEIHEKVEKFLLDYNITELKMLIISIQCIVCIFMYFFKNYYTLLLTSQSVILVGIVCIFTILFKDSIWKFLKRMCQMSDIIINGDNGYV